MIINGYETEIIRSKRRSVSIEISKDLRVIVRAPRSFPDSEIAKAVAKHDLWIRRAIEHRKLLNQKHPEPSPEEREALFELAEKLLPPKIEYWSKLTGLVPTGVKITSAEKRFGSCSPKNSICFSYRLMQYPEAAIDYVVLHELAHIKHHNHSKDFYALIERYMPDYKSRERLLRS